MAHWLLKTEPGEYSFAKLVEEGKTTWNGVSNNLALQYMRQMRKDELVLIYHTGEERQIVGIAQLTSNPYPDPYAKDGKRVVIDLRPVEALATPVTLAQIKADPAFADFELVRLGRLSVMPVSPERWKAIVALGK